MAKLTRSDNLDKYFNEKTSNYNFRRVYKNLVELCDNDKIKHKRLRIILNLTQFQIIVIQDKKYLATLKINKTKSPILKYIKGVEPNRPGPRHIPGSSSGFGMGSDSPDADSGGHYISLMIIAGK